MKLSARDVSRGRVLDIEVGAIACKVRVGIGGGIETIQSVWNHRSRLGYTLPRACSVGGRFADAVAGRPFIDATVCAGPRELPGRDLGWIVATSRPRRHAGAPASTSLLHN